MKITELIEEKAQIERGYNQEILKREREMARLRTEVQVLKNEQQEKLEPVNKELIQAMKEIGVNEIKTESGFTAKYKSVDADKMSNWSNALDRMDKKQVASQLEETHPQYIRVTESMELDLKGIKNAIKNEELFMTPEGIVIDDNGEKLSDKPIFKLRDENVEVG